MEPAVEPVFMGAPGSKGITEITRLQFLKHTAEMAFNNTVAVAAQKG